MFIKTAGTIALMLNISMMIICFYIAKFFASGFLNKNVSLLECGLQNGTLATFVGTQLFGEI